MGKIALFIIILLTGLSTGCVLFGGTPSPSETVRFVVKDQDGMAVSGAEVSMSWYHGESASGFTDADGVVTLTASGASGLTCGVFREGYYRSGGKIFGAGFTSLKGAEADGLRVHMNPLYMRGGMYLTRPPEEMHIELKKIADPVPMYVRRIERMLPALNEKIGFDFEAGDWVAPYGKGRRSDIAFEGRGSWRAWNDYEVNVKISIGENNFEGMTIRKTPDNRDLHSDMLSPAIAPLDGYEKGINIFRRHSPDGDREYSQWKDLLYLFRTRAELSGEGLVIANYGKMYDGIDCFLNSDGTISVSFTYYFNPSRKSRSLEYNGTNLFKKADAPKRILRPGFPPPEESPIDPEIDHFFRL